MTEAIQQQRESHNLNHPELQNDTFAPQERNSLHNAQPDQGGESHLYESSKVIVDQNINVLKDRASAHSQVAERVSSSSQSRVVQLQADPFALRQELNGLHSKIDSILKHSHPAMNSTQRSVVSLASSHISPVVETTTLRRSSVHNASHQIVHTYHTLQVPALEVQAPIHAHNTLRASIAKVDSVLMKSSVISSPPRKSVKFADEYATISASTHISANPYSKPTVNLSRSVVTPYTNYYSVSATTSPHKPRFNEEKLDNIISHILSSSRLPNSRPIHHQRQASAAPIIGSEKTSHKIQYISNVQKEATRQAPAKTIQLEKDVIGEVENDRDSLILDHMDTHVKHMEDNGEKYTNYHTGSLDHDEEEKPTHKVSKRQAIINRRRNQNALQTDRKVQESPKKEEKQESKKEAPRSRDNDEFVRKGPYEQKSATKVNSAKLSKLIQNDEKEIEDFDFSKVKDQ